MCGCVKLKIKSKGYNEKLLKACKHVFTSEVAVMGQLYSLQNNTGNVESRRIVHFIEYIKLKNFYRDLFHSPVETICRLIQGSVLAVFTTWTFFKYAIIYHMT